MVNVNHAAGVQGPADRGGDGEGGRSAGAADFIKSIAYYLNKISSFRL
jgi:hypothetical protein